MNKDNIGRLALMREVGRILGEPDIRPGDNFIELGGNSILALQVAGVLHDKEGIEINIAQLLADRLGNVCIDQSKTRREIAE
ncbi:acyl carrier protein [Rugamonas sp. DEMB1]|uniref:acyl carrier protein n=1 Tax=Rugamonas sp. DEMB1 TaxID=3039386 RepID=UPI00187773CE|nr:acyl carrier protein [Rugamonas sp. DEMB1]WGG53061.1 acyl carrier protein [Rugamonas sp. DEMB1]